MTGPLPIPVQLLPRPRVIVWHGDIEDIVDAGRIDAIRAAYDRLVDQVPGICRSAGGNDWSGWHLPARWAVETLADIVVAVGPVWWTVLVEATDAAAGPLRPCRECGHVHTGPGLGGICIGCPCDVRGIGVPVQANADDYR